MAHRHRALGRHRPPLARPTLRGGPVIVRAYRSLTDVHEFGMADRLPGDDVLPGFDIPVAELFED